MKQQDPCVGSGQGGAAVGARDYVHMCVCVCLAGQVVSPVHHQKGQLGMLPLVFLLSGRTGGICTGWP